MAVRWAHGILLTGALVAAPALLGAPSAGAATPSQPTPTVAPPSVMSGGGALHLHGSGTFSSTAGGAGPAVVAGTCDFTTDGSYVHISSTAFEASGHGSWTNINCPTATAVVTIQLQQYFSDNTWRDAGARASKTVKSGGGSGNWAVGRAACVYSNQTTWRSWVDVDLVGVSDTNEKGYTTPQTFGCRR